MKLLNEREDEILLRWCLECEARKDLLESGQGGRDGWLANARILETFNWHSKYQDQEGTVDNSQ